MNRSGTCEGLAAGFERDVAFLAGVDFYEQLIVLPPPNVWVRYIYAREQIKPERKPFRATDYGKLIYSGTCE